MAEELAFARKASGLVRGLSMTDAFAVGFMNQGLTPSIWVTITLGLGVFIGGNLIIACHHLHGPRRHRLPHRLGRARRLHAAVGRRVRLQLAHHPPDLRHRPELRRRHDLAHVDLRAGAAGRRPGPHHHLQLPRLDRGGRLGGEQRLDHLLHRDAVQHRRLPLRGVRHQVLRHDRRRSSCSSASAAASSSASCSRSRRKANFVAKWNAAAGGQTRRTTSDVHRQGGRRRRPGRCRRRGTGARPWASWSPCRGCSPTPTRSRSSAARSSARTRPSSGPTSSPSSCRSCS